MPANRVISIGGSNHWERSLSDPVRYLVLVKLHDSSPAKLVKLVPRLQEQLSRLSKATPEQVFRSATADVFGYFISSTLKARQIVAAIESPGSSYLSDVEPILDGKDGLFVLELADDFTATTGFTRSGTWLQHN